MVNDEKHVILSVLDPHSIGAALILSANLEQSKIFFTTAAGFHSCFSQVLRDMDHPGRIWLSGIPVFYNSTGIVQVLSAALAAGNDITWISRGNLDFFHKYCNDSFRIMEDKDATPGQTVSAIFHRYGSQDQAPAMFLEKNPPEWPIMVLAAWKFCFSEPGSLASTASFCEHFFAQTAEHTGRQIYLMHHHLLAVVHWLLGSSHVMLNWKNLLKSAALEDQCHCLISAETGCGAEAAALLIHVSGSRAFRHFLTVKCDAMDQETLEIELFGSEQGLPGMGRNRIGILEKASGGTVLLENVDKLSPRLQARLVQLLDRRVRLVTGGKKQSDVRIISTTGAEIGETVKNGSFRRDLFHLLGEIVLTPPTMRASADDLLATADFLLFRISTELDRNHGLVPERITSLLNEYSWPGNLRELDQLLRRYCALGENCPLPETVLPVKSQELPVSLSAARTLEEHKLDIIAAAYLETNRNKAHTARTLDISLNTLKAALKKKGLS
ncbi:MAG: sigma 54-interacting transcriptional regulator [Candidatus Wallbacteria bacterium]|nr:sigma 54-interacting transcriptional regulator [Candidatus Wallbacteria bacterium]